MRFKFDNYENSVGIKVDSDGKQIPFEKPEAFDLKEKIKGASFGAPFQKADVESIQEIIETEKRDPIVALGESVEQMLIAPTLQETKSKMLKRAESIQQREADYEAEAKSARIELSKIVRDELKKKIVEKGFVNIEGGTVLDGRQFADASIYFIGTIIAKDFENNDEVIEKIIDVKQKGEKFSLDDKQRDFLDAGFEDSFEKGEIVRAAYVEYEYRCVGTELARNKKNLEKIENWRLQQGIDKKMSSTEKKVLQDRLMFELATHQDMINKFVSLRKKKPQARLNGENKQIIMDIIRKFIDKEFFIEKSKKNKFEMPKEQRELFEDELLRAIDNIKQVRADDLDIDALPIEKHFTGNIRDKMELLLNSSGSIGDEDGEISPSKYWDELIRLDNIAKEIISLGVKNIECVVYEGNTFFVKINKQQVEINHEKTLKEIIGNDRRLMGFKYNAKLFYKSLMDDLRSEAEWQSMPFAEQQIFIERAMKLYVEKSIGRQNDDLHKAVFEIITK